MHRVHLIEQTPMMQFSLCIEAVIRDFLICTFTIVDCDVIGFDETMPHIPLKFLDCQAFYETILKQIKVLLQVFLLKGFSF